MVSAIFEPLTHEEPDRQESAHEFRLEHVRSEVYQRPGMSRRTEIARL